MTDTFASQDTGAPVHPEEAVPEMLEGFHGDLETIQSSFAMAENDGPLGAAKTNSALPEGAERESAGHQYLTQAYGEVVTFITKQLEHQYEHEVGLRQVIIDHQGEHALTRPESWQEYYSRRFDDEIINYWAGLGLAYDRIVVKLPAELDFMPWADRSKRDIRKHRDGTDVLVLEREPLYSADMMATAEAMLWQEYVGDKERASADETYDDYRARRLSLALRSELDFATAKLAHTGVPLTIQAPIYELPRWDAVILGSARPDMARLLPETELEYSNLVVFIAKTLEAAYRENAFTADEAGIRNFINERFDDVLVYILGFGARLMQRTGQALNIAIADDEYTPWLERAQAMLEAYRQQNTPATELIHFEWKHSSGYADEAHDLGVAAVTAEELEYVARAVPTAA